MPNDTIENLERLAALHREGFLTRAQFEAQRDIVLAQAQTEGADSTVASPPAEGGAGEGQLVRRIRANGSKRLT